MADDKKKPKEAPAKRSIGTEVWFLLAGLFLLSILVNRIYYYLATVSWDDPGAWNQFVNLFLYPLWAKWKVAAVILSAASVTLLIYSNRKLQEVINDEEKIYGPTPEETFLEDVGVVERNKEDPRWPEVVRQSNSDNPADWRLAILEADVMLEDVLRANGFAGDSIGEMLKSAEGNDQFSTLEAAWEAHKIRNNIAHGGSNYQLNDRETKRAITLFGQVFKEFKIIF